MKKYLFLSILAISLFFITNSFYILTQIEQSVELRFGKAVDQETEPGLKLKVPFVDDVVFFDKRILHINAASKEVIASDRKRLIVDAFAKYKIKNALLFYQSVRTEKSAEIKLSSVIESSLRQVLGNSPLSALLQEGRRNEIMSDIRDIVNEKAASFGIEVLDVRIMRSDLPKENSAAIYRRMQTEREREAKEFRARGAEMAVTITSTADKEVSIILADANKNSEIMKGEGDGERNRIFAEAFGRDPEFFAFYRAMQAYETALIGGETSLILSPDSEFFKFFGNIKPKSQ